MTIPEQKKLQELATLSFLNKVDKLFTSPEAKASYDPDEIRKGIRREAYRIQKQYGLRPKLTGSMHSGLNLPDAVDIDFFADVQDRKKFEQVIRDLKESKVFRSSPYNKPGTGYAVFSRKSPGTSGFPVDLAVAYGGPGAKYRKATTDPELQKALYKPSTRSLKEIFTRIFPHMIRGDVKIHPLGGRVEAGYGED